MRSFVRFLALSCALLLSILPGHASSGAPSLAQVIQAPLSAEEVMAPYAAALEEINASYGLGIRITEYAAHDLAPILYRQNADEVIAALRSILDKADSSELPEENGLVFYLLIPALRAFKRVNAEKGSRYMMTDSNKYGLLAAYIGLTEDEIYLKLAESSPSEPIGKGSEAKGNMNIDTILQPYEDALTGLNQSFQTRLFIPSYARAELAAALKDKQPETVIACARQILETPETLAASDTKEPTSLISLLVRPAARAIRRVQTELGADIVMADSGRYAVFGHYGCMSEDDIYQEIDASLK